MKVRGLMNIGKRVLFLLLSSLILTSSCTRVFADNESMPTTVVEDGVGVSSRIWELLFGKRANAPKDNEELIVGGDVFGARIYHGYVSISKDVEGTSLLAGDVIKSIDGRVVKRVSEMSAVLGIDGEHTVVIKRGTDEITCTINSPDVGQRVIRASCDGAAGIGTVTYIDPEDMTFGGLGHGICDESGRLFPLESGRVTGVILGGAKKGEKGDPGELVGVLTDNGCGEIYSNTSTGVFGRLSDWSTEGALSLPIAKRDEVKAGTATIISTIKNGKKMSYTVELYDINTAETETKCFKIRVTDKALLSLTGGIVRGMSGSPIIQDGKLVGAVTHVMVADPTEGYGIFIENMLNASQIPMVKAS